MQTEPLHFQRFYYEADLLKGSYRDFFAEQVKYGFIHPAHRFQGTGWNAPLELVDCATLGGVSYVACAREGANDERRVGALIFAHWPNSFQRRNRGYSWRAFDEGMVERSVIGATTSRRCPRRILDQLDDVEDVYTNRIAQQNAQQWRDRCYRRLERVASQPKLSKGDLVKFPEEHYFGEKYGWRSVLRFVSGSTFSEPHDPKMRFRLPHWREGDPVEIVDQSPAAEARSNLESLLG